MKSTITTLVALVVLVYPTSVLAVPLTVTVINPAPGVTGETNVFGINDAGLIVGYFSDAAGRHGFIRSVDGSYNVFDVPGASDTRPLGINDAGQVAGFSDVGGFIRDVDGSFTTFNIPGPPGSTTFPYDINDVGQVVGKFSDTSEGHGFLREPDGNTTILAGFERARGINDTGQITGNFVTENGANGLLREADGTSITINVPGALQTAAWGINDAGQIVGQFVDGTGNHGFIRNTDGTFTTLDVLGASTTNLIGINDSGQVMGMYFSNSGSFPFVATIPELIPEPSTFTLAAFALLGFAYARRRPLCRIL